MTLKKNESQLRARITRQSLLLGALVGVNIILFIGFAKTVFGEVQKPMSALGLGLTILTVINFLRNRSVLMKPDTISEAQRLARMERSYRSLSRVKWILIGLIPVFLFGGLFFKNQPKIFSKSNALVSRQLDGKCRGEKLVKPIEIRFSQGRGTSNSTEMKYDGRILYLRNDLIINNRDIDLIEDAVDSYGAPNIKFHLNSQGTQKLSQGMKENYGHNAVFLVDGSVRAAPSINGQINDGKMQVLLAKEVDKNGQVFGLLTSDLCSSQE